MTGPVHKSPDETLEAYIARRVLDAPELPAGVATLARLAMGDGVRSRLRDLAGPLAESA